MIRNVIILISCFFLYSCSDFEVGYSDGYEGRDKNNWIVFAKDRYHDGYHSGQAEKFQQDWLTEDPIEIGLLHPPTTFIRTDPLNVMPDEYKRIAQDVYQIAD